MKETRHIMGMPVTLNCPNVSDKGVFEEVFNFFHRIDKTYSPYIESSEVSKINRGELQPSDYSKELREILSLAEKTKKETHGYFDVWHKGIFDPSGIVKGWAIQKAAKILGKHTQDYYVEAGGDTQVAGMSDSNQAWRIGIRNPFERSENVSVITLKDQAVATSGTAIRGQHIYNPLGAVSTEIVSLSVVGKSIVDADRYATAAFAMGNKGIEFIESLPGYEGYVVNKDKLATPTSGWHTYEVKS